jgi:hypothetical protein
MSAHNGVHRTYRSWQPRKRRVSFTLRHGRKRLDMPERPGLSQKGKRDPRRRLPPPGGLDQLADPYQLSDPVSPYMATRKADE